MGDKSRKKKKPKAKASKKVDTNKKVDTKVEKPSQPPDWAKATRYEIYRG